MIDKDKETAPSFRRLSRDRPSLPPSLLTAIAIHLSKPHTAIAAAILAPVNCRIS